MKPVRVLLVDDDMELRAVIAEGLRDDGAEVIEAGASIDAFDAVAAARVAERYFDIVISDVQMPGGDGLELLGLLRRAGYRAPVVLLSGFVDQPTRARALRLGAAAILAKPLDLQILRMIVRSAGERRWWCGGQTVDPC